VTATVQSVLAPNRYVLQLQGMLFELEANLFLSVGDKLPLRVREQGAGRLVLETLPRDEPAPEGHAPPGSASGNAVVLELGRMKGPLDPATVDLVARLSRDPGTRQAAAFLAAHGLEPTQELVDALASLNLPGTEPSGGTTLLEPLLSALARRVVEDPLEIPSKIPLLSGPPPQELESALRTILEGSPRLRMMDQLIEAVQTARPSKVPPAEVPDRLRAAVSLVRSATPETLGEVLRQIPELPREALRELLSVLSEMERTALSQIPELSQAREGRGTLLGAADRLADLRLVNQLSQVREDGVRILEVPLRVEGRLQYLPLRIAREGPRPGSADPSSVVVTFDIDFTKIGFVRALLATATKTLRIRFQVRDRGVRAHFERFVEDLSGALRAEGFEPLISADVAAAPPRESLFDAFASPSEFTSLDVTL
jgi:hypothetical protein